MEGGDMGYRESVLDSLLLRHSPALVEDAAGQHVARTLAALQDEGSFQQEQRVHLPERREWSKRPF